MTNPVEHDPADYQIDVALNTAFTCIHSFDKKHLVPEHIRTMLHALRSEVTTRFPHMPDIAADDDGSWLACAMYEVQDILMVLKPALTAAQPFVKSTVAKLQETPMAGYPAEYWQYILEDVHSAAWYTLVYQLEGGYDDLSDIRSDNTAMLIILAWMVYSERVGEYLSAVLQSMLVIEQYHFSMTVLHRRSVVRNHVLNALYHTMADAARDVPFAWQSPLLAERFVAHCADLDLFSAVLYDDIQWKQRYSGHVGVQQLAARLQGQA